MTFTQMTKSFIQETSSGTDADTLIQAYAGNLLDNPFLHIELDSINELLHMLNGSKHYFIYPNQVSDESLFTALYPPTIRSPLARCYFIRKKTKNQVSEFQTKIAEYQYDFKAINDFTFAYYIEHLSLEDRKEKFLQRRNDKTGAIKKIFDGRKENTTTSGGIVFQTDGCLVCGNKITHNLSTTLSLERGLFISYNVCEDCYNKSKNSEKSNLDFLLKSLKVENDFLKSDKLSKSELLNMTVQMVIDELECTIDNTDNFTVTAYRNSGFKIILRLQDPDNEEKIDYGYMIFNKLGKQVARVDSANHHNEILEVAPDHFHYDLKTNNKTVKSSYTTGYIPIDIIGIKKILEEFESKES